VCGSKGGDHAVLVRSPLTVTNVCGDMGDTWGSDLTGEHCMAIGSGGVRC
jgi:hypothetical protein